VRARSSESTSTVGVTGLDPSADFESACLLLLLGRHPASGSELCSRLQRTGLADIDRAQVDEMLRAFERAGLARASGSSDADQTYRLTPAGVARLDSAADDLRGAQVMLGWFLARCGEHVVLDAPAAH
jgi:DNA-binding PadR family transcriptional regulator